MTLRERGQQTIDYVKHARRQILAADRTLNKYLLSEGMYVRSPHDCYKMRRGQINSLRLRYFGTTERFRFTSDSLRKEAADALACRQDMLDNADTRCPKICGQDDAWYERREAEFENAIDMLAAAALLRKAGE